MHKTRKRLSILFAVAVGAFSAAHAQTNTETLQLDTSRADSVTAIIKSLAPMARAPSSGARKPARDPWNLPIGVRQALTRKTSLTGCTSGPGGPRNGPAGRTGLQRPAGAGGDRGTTNIVRGRRRD